MAGWQLCVCVPAHYADSQNDEIRLRLRAVGRRSSVDLVRDRVGALFSFNSVEVEILFRCQQHSSIVSMQHG